eukprot:4174008-Amphidinium_carterae.1
MLVKTLVIGQLLVEKHKLLNTQTQQHGTPCSELEVKWKLLRCGDHLTQSSIRMLRASLVSRSFADATQNSGQKVA